MKKKIIIGVLIAAVLGGGLFAVFGRGKEESPYVMVTVERGDLEERVLTTATVEAANEFELSFATSGRVASVNIAVGDVVTSETELARLDTAALSARIRQQRASRDSARASLDQAIAGTSAAGIAVAQSSVDSAQTSLENAQANLTDTQRTTAEDLAVSYDNMSEVFRDVELSAEAAIQAMNPYFSVTCSYQCLNSWGVFLSAPIYESLIEAGKVNADNALLRIQTTVSIANATTPQATMDLNASSLMGDVGIILATLDTAYEGFQDAGDKAIIQVARLDITSRLLALDNQAQAIAAVKSLNITNISAKENAVRNAEATLATTQAQLNQVLEPPRTVDLASLRASVSSAQANLDAAVANFNNAILIAPIGGIITQVNVQAGEIAGSSLIAVAMVSGATYSVEANVPEADIAKIAVLNPVLIKLDALVGQKFTGNVVSIDPAEQIIGGVVTFKVTTDISGDATQLKPGMTADIDILTAEAIDVLFVPQRSIVRDSGESFLRTVVDGEIVRILVEVGIRSADGFIQIKSGVTEGQEVVNFVR